MQKTIFITGSTDGIGLETAKKLLLQGHCILLHGRNPSKLKETEKALTTLSSDGLIESYLADLSNIAEVEDLVNVVSSRHDKLDVLINNAGIYKANSPVTQDGLDVRFMVNTIAPYVLTQGLLPLLGTSGRVINLSSAAQSPVNIEALMGKVQLHEAFEAYAQSKLAFTEWSRSMALSIKDKGPAIIAVNPGSLLGTKMVKQGFNVAGNDISIGVDILIRVALTEEFKKATGKYWDNDSGQFASPHPDALNPEKCQETIKAIELVVAELKQSIKT